MNQEPEAQLAYFFYRNGCLRLPNATRRKEGSQKYKKGYELRLVAQTKNELKQIRRLLQQMGFKLGKPYQKGRQTVQPVYGKQAVEQFCNLLAQLEG